MSGGTTYPVNLRRLARVFGVTLDQMSSMVSLAAVVPGSEPDTLIESAIAYNTATHRIRVKTDSGWQDVPTVDDLGEGGEGPRKGRKTRKQNR